MTPTRPTVVLLHGLARSRHSMGRLRRAIADAGHRTWSRSYPSMRAPLQQLAAELARRIRREAPGPLIGVTHSLGGILVRHMGELPWRGLVMIAPPNRGSLVAAKLRQRPLLRHFLGPAGRDLASARSWPPPPEPFCVIAGTRALALGNPTSWVSHALHLFPERTVHDGTVALEETYLPNMTDFATVDAPHTWISDHPQTARLVLTFLEHGRFASSQIPPADAWPEIRSPEC